MLQRMLGCLCLIASLPLGLAAEEAASKAPKIAVANDQDAEIRVWICSLKDSREEPCEHSVVEPGKQKEFALPLPDPYIVVVDRGQQRTRSKAIKLREFLEKHPGYSVQIKDSGIDDIKSPPVEITLRPAKDVVDDSFGVEATVEWLPSK